MSHRIVLDLYDHTSHDEVLDILAELKRIGIDDARYEVDDAPKPSQPARTNCQYCNRSFKKSYNRQIHEQLNCLKRPK